MLRSYLDMNGLTQRWLARQIPCREATVSDWVTKGVIPAPTHMRRVAEVTGGAVPVAAWFEGAPKQTDASR